MWQNPWWNHLRRMWLQVQQCKWIQDMMCSFRTLIRTRPMQTNCLQFSGTHCSDNRSHQNHFMSPLQVMEMHWPSNNRMQQFGSCWFCRCWQLCANSRNNSQQCRDDPWDFVNLIKFGCHLVIRYLQGSAHRWLSWLSTGLSRGRSWDQLRPDQHSGSLNNWGESAAFVITSANG